MNSRYMNTLCSIRFVFSFFTMFIFSFIRHSIAIDYIHTYTRLYYWMPVSKDVTFGQLEHVLVRKLSFWWAGIVDYRLVSNCKICSHNTFPGRHRLAGDFWKHNYCEWQIASVRQWFAVTREVVRVQGRSKFITFRIRSPKYTVSSWFSF